MMNLFEDFSHGPMPNASSGAPDEDNLESFDRGYKAGWDDAAKAHAESQTKASSVLVRNLETAEFTFAEARGLVLTSITPMLTEIANTLFPGLAEASLRAHITHELEQIIASDTPDSISLDVSPDDFPAVSALLDNVQGFESVVAKKNETLGAGQVKLSCGSVEKRIDIPAALAGIQDALANLTAEQPHSQPEVAHAG